MHKQIQDNLFKSGEKKVYSQSQKIYDYYSHIEHERQMREKEIEQKMIDDVMERTLRAQTER